jgi:hypothetical protein
MTPDHGGKGGGRRGTRQRRGRRRPAQRVALWWRRRWLALANTAEEETADVAPSHGGHYRWLCSAITGDRKEELRLDKQKKMSLYKEELHGLPACKI